MRFLILLSLLTTIFLASGSPIDPERWLINRPTKDMIFNAKTTRLQVKGVDNGVKGGHPRPTQPSLAKGEYMCGKKVCRLQPGEVPKGCNGVCQYPLAYSDNIQPFEHYTRVSF